MNVKRILALLIIVAILPTMAVAENSHTDTALSLLGHISLGEYDLALSLMNDEAKASITPEALQAGWESIAAQFGKLTGYKPSSAENDYAVIICEFENASVKFSCVFDDEGLIKTFSLTPENYGDTEALPLELPEGASVKEVKLFEGTNEELEGLITLPKDYDFDTPIAVMVQGSGPSDRDESVVANKPFRDIAYGLAKNGVASIRHDKTTYAHPELFTSVESVTVDFELVDPALEALRLVRDMGFKNVYLLGHSLGGMMTPYIMSRSDEGFKGGIILAGSTRKFWEIMRDQNIAILQQSADAGEHENELAMTEIESNVEKAQAVCAMTQEEAKSQTEAVMGMPAFYLWSIDALDRASLPKKNGLPLLILQGEADFQVTFDEDYKAWKNLLGDDELFSFISYPGLSHIFMPAREGYGISQITEAYAVPEYVDERVINDISDWIKTH